MLQFILGIFVGSIIGIFIMSIISVTRSDEAGSSPIIGHESKRKTETDTDV